MIAKSIGTVKYTDLIPAEGLDPTTNQFPVHEAKQFDGEAPEVLELWGMWSTHSLLSLLDILWPGVEALGRI